MELALGTEPRQEYYAFELARKASSGVVLNPSVWLDGELIEDNGKYVHPDLVRICREMNIAGY